MKQQNNTGTEPMSMKRNVGGNGGRLLPRPESRGFGTGLFSGAGRWVLGIFARRDPLAPISREFSRLPTISHDFSPLLTLISRDFSLFPGFFSRRVSARAGERRAISSDVARWVVIVGTVVRCEAPGKLKLGLQPWAGGWDWMLRGRECRILGHRRHVLISR